MDTFITWTILAEYTTLVGVVFMVVEFTKELPFLRKITTKYWSFLIALLLIVLINLQGNTIQGFDFVLYTLSAMAISLSANGLYNFNKSGKEE